MLLLGAAASLPAQSKTIAPSPSLLFAVETGASRVAAATDTLPKPLGDHRWKGALIGGLTGLTLGYILDEYSSGGLGCSETGDCDDMADTGPWGSISGTVIGGTIGYFIGKGSRRRPPPPPPTHPPLPKSSVLTPFEGGIVGAVVGAIAFTVVAQIDHGGAGEPPIENASAGMLIGSIVGAGLTP